MSATQATTETRIGQANARRAVKDVESLCALGDRFAGQAGDGPSADYVEENLLALGLEIERSSDDLVSFQETKCHLGLEDGTAIEAIAAYYSPSTPGLVEAPLVYVGSGTEESYEGKDVDGAIVVFEEDALAWELFWLGSYAERAASHGAVGIVCIHPFPWTYIMSMEFGARDFTTKRFADPALPAVAVSASGGMRIMEAIGAGKAQAQLEVETKIGPCTSDQVAGVLRGSKYPDERIIVLAHRDSPIPPAANDNASGTACVLEVARILAEHPAERSIVFLSVAAEEGRAEGTYRYIEGLGEEIENVKAAISIDMIGGGGPLRVVDWIQWLDTSEAIQFTPWLVEKLEASADALGYQLERVSTGAGGDGGRFLNVGVPAAWLWKPDDFRYHSREDKPENVDGTAIKAAAEITADTVLAIANGDESAN